MNYLRRCKEKKGFTIIELIVVIAIIGVILAIVLPVMFTSDKPSKGKAYAKSYYYTVQDFMSRKRINATFDSTAALDPSHNGGDFYFYTTVNARGDIVASGVISDSGTFTGAMETAADVAADASISNQNYKDLVSDYALYMSNNVTESEYAGTFYCVVDSDYRVQAAYWSEGTMAQLVEGGNTLAFEDDYIVSGYVTCSFPIEFSEVSGASGKKMFDYTY